MFYHLRQKHTAEYSRATKEEMMMSNPPRVAGVLASDTPYDSKANGGWKLMIRSQGEKAGL